jgi:hypothetical protein
MALLGKEMLSPTWWQRAHHTSVQRNKCCVFAIMQGEVMDLCEKYHGQATVLRCKTSNLDNTSPDPKQPGTWFPSTLYQHLHLAPRNRQDCFSTTAGPRSLYLPALARTLWSQGSLDVRHPAIYILKPQDLPSGWNAPIIAVPLSVSSTDPNLKAGVN